MYFNRESVIVLKKSGLSVREISKKTGISKTTVGRWLQEADKVSCIVPFYHVSFNQQFNKLVEKGKFVEVIACEDVYARYKAESDVKFLSSFKGKNNFLLIVTDKIMILGLFKEDESFDQNRLLTSKNSDSLIWATNLLKNFKKRINEF